MNPLPLTLVVMGLSAHTVTSAGVPAAVEPAGWWIGQFGARAYEEDTVVQVTREAGALKVAMPPRFAKVVGAKLAGDVLIFDMSMDASGTRLTFKGKISGNTMEVTAAAGVLSGTLMRLQEGEAPPGNALMPHEATEYWKPTAKAVDPGPYVGMVPAPSDAIVLFDGKDLRQWISRDGSEARWKIEGGSFTVVKGTGDISTRRKFGDYQLHIEWQIPADIPQEGFGWGNSGLFLQDVGYESGRGWDWYEIQILDSYHRNPVYVNGQAASVYKQNPPLVNATRKPGEWNVYDVAYTAPRFNADGALFSPARVTLFHNGVLVQNDFPIRGNTPWIGLPAYTSPHGRAPISLQDHGDPVRFRNIWIRER